MKPRLGFGRVGVLCAGLALLAVLGGCAAGPRLYVNRQADMTLYKRVIVVPFANLSADPYAPGRILRALSTELVIADRFQIVDPSLLLAEFERTGTTPDATGQFDLNRLRDAATTLKATAVIRGSVTEYGIHRQGTDEWPVVSFDCEMVDVQTGIVIWRMAVLQSGRGRLPIVGGMADRTFSRVTEEACRRAVAVLREKVL